LLAVQLITITHGSATLRTFQIHNAKPDIVNYSRQHLFIHLLHNKSYKMALRNH